MNAKIVPIIAGIVVLLSGGALVYSLDIATKKDDSRVPFVSPSGVWSSAEGFFGSVAQGIESFFTPSTTTSNPKSTATPAPSTSPRTPGASPTPKASPTPVSSPTTVPSPKTPSDKSSTPPVTTPAPQPTNCRRFTITHLDGSQSNRCYTSADYAELSRLSSQLSSAQTFYQFHMDGVARYQALYDESGSSLWIDARNSSQANADQEQSKIGPLQLQMYTIESRGRD